MSFEIIQAGTLEQGSGRQIEEPGTDDAAATPEFGDIAKVEIVLIVLWIAYGCCLSIDLLLMLTDVRVPQDIKPFGIGRHDTVLDTVVHHFDEVTSTMWPTVQVALLGGRPMMKKQRLA